MTVPLTIIWKDFVPFVWPFQLLLCSVGCESFVVQSSVTLSEKCTLVNLKRFHLGSVCVLRLVVTVTKVVTMENQAAINNLKKAKFMDAFRLCSSSWVPQTPTQTHHTVDVLSYFQSTISVN